VARESPPDQTPREITQLDEAPASLTLLDEHPQVKSARDEVPLDPVAASGGPAPVDGAADTRRQYDRPAPAHDRDRPARGSVAELSLRLERLPAGHPSSPYNDDGTLKAPVPRLKDLELPLPGEDRPAAPGPPRDHAELGGAG